VGDLAASRSLYSCLYSYPRHWLRAMASLSTRFDSLTAMPLPLRRWPTQASFLLHTARGCVIQMLALPSDYTGQWWPLPGRPLIP